MQHEIIQNEDGTLSESANDATETKLLLEMETLNHNVVDKLVDAGYSDAGSLKRMLKIVSPEQTKARDVVLTQPGTTERIKQLVLSKTAGDFFRATNGGGCMNSNDCIVAAQLKSKKKLLPGLIKEKKKVYAHRKLRKAMSKIETSSSKPMTLNHLKDFIRLRNPEVLSKELVGGKPKVQELWKKKYAAMPIASLRWTNAKEKLLDDLKNDRVGRFDETGLWKKSCEDRISFLNERLQSIPSNDALQVVKMFMAKHFKTEMAASRFLKSIFSEDKIFTLDRAEDCGISTADDSYYSDAPESSTRYCRSSGSASSKKKGQNKIPAVIDYCSNDRDINEDEEGNNIIDEDEEDIEYSATDGEESDGDNTLSSSKYCGSSHSEGSSEDDLDTMADDELDVDPFGNDNGNKDRSESEDSDIDDEEGRCFTDDDTIPVLDDAPMDSQMYPYLDGTNVLFTFPMKFADCNEFATASKNISPELKYPRLIVQWRDIDRMGRENITTNEYKRVSERDGLLNDVLIHFYARW